MRFLLVDTADSRGCVALCRGDNVVTVLAHPQGEDYSSWLLPAARSVLAANGLTLSELDAYAVCSGPGSFTGLRVGLTTVKAWAEVYSKPIVAVSRLEAFSLPLSNSCPPSTAFIATYLDAQRDQVFAALYSSGGDCLESETVIALEAFFNSVNARDNSGPVFWRTPDPHLLRRLPQWPSQPAGRHIVEQVNPPFASELAALAFKRIRQGHVTDALSLDANYVRRSDAEIFWKGIPAAKS